eukprot:Gb_02778 [translate_table: standard]
MNYHPDMMNFQVHSASSPQVLALFPEVVGGTIEMEDNRDLQANGQMEDRNEEHDMVPVFHASANRQVYPSPLAEHEALLANHTYFYNLFNSFHAALGTRLTVPNIGGQELDLHLLYREVTACGGLEQVIKDRRWKEVATTLKIPSSITNPSFVLRKHYIDLLYHFEQVHYFGAQGQLAPPPGPLPAPQPSTKSMDNEISYQFPVDPEQSSKRRKKRIDSAQLFGVDPGSSVGHIVTGAINSKFDNGYLVTVVVGSEKLKGVLYHVPTETSMEQFARVPGLMSNVGSELDSLGFEVQVTKKKKDRVPKRDPNAPRPSRNGYNFFYAEQRARLKKIHAQTDREISRMVIDLWNRLSDNEKLPYIEKSQQDKERYKTEMMAYRERLKFQACSEGYNSGESPEAVGEQIGGHGITPYFHDGSYDYHVSLDAEADTNSFHIHQQQGVPPEVIGVPVAEHELYSGEGDGHVYSVRFPHLQVSESDLGGSGCLQQTYEVSGDRCSYQTQSNVSQSGLVPCSMTSDHLYWDQEGEQSYNVREDGQTLSLYPENPFS